MLVGVTKLDGRHHRRRRDAETLKEAELSDVQVRGLGVRFWYGGPWASTTLVTARR